MTMKHYLTTGSLDGQPEAKKTTTCMVAVKKFDAHCNIQATPGVLRLNNKSSLKKATMDNELRQVLMPLTILGTIGTTLVLFTRTISDYILKKKMIEKGFVNEDTQAIFKRNTDENKYSSLKWGLIILFAGISLVILEYVPHERDSTLPYGLFAVFVSLGFLIYYFMVKKELDK
jgi:hypothetical protein